MSLTVILKRTARSMLDQREDRQHWRTFQQQRPDLADIAQEVKREAENLRAEHERYTSTVSIPEAAVSLETAALLVVLCRRLNARTALDLGSGFSSWVLANEDVELVSIDDSDEWRGKTQAYLDGAGVAVEVGSLADLAALTGPFDLVFHDLGTPETRAEWLPKALSVTGGVAVLDDLHKPRYRAVCEALDHGTMHRVEHVTRDRFGRYAWLWTP